MNERIQTHNERMFREYDRMLMMGDDCEPIEPEIDEYALEEKYQREKEQSLEDLD
jgi:hypothetical protein